VDQFVARSIRTTRDHRTAARTLFELLLPNEIKKQAPDQDDVILILDEEAARYPWELLEDGWSNREKPFVIEHGLLRQLESRVLRESVLNVAEKTALVIGDPISKYPELEGAQEEAKSVARTLQSEGRFRAEQRIRPTSEQVVNALFAEGYQILHLAGHGVYRFMPKEAIRCKRCGQSLSETELSGCQESLKPVTGMIIGDGLVLSPKEVHQMRYVPELVFINCCYLGYVEADAKRSPEERNERNDYNRIAANVATEFIRMGVRAVIAAGWAVDDAAAHTFAVTFYEQMLQGRPFGKAVHEARKVTFERHQETNTWGAYQCYGDPDYRLIREVGDGETQSEDLKLVSPSEAIAELNNITARLKTMAGGDTQYETGRIESILREIEKKKWPKDGRLCAALGRALGEAKRFGEAIDWYKQAVSTDDGEVTLRDIEQLANLEIRQAVRQWENGEPLDRVLKTIDGGIQRLESLMEGLRPFSRIDKDKGDSKIGRTSERLSLLGSAYKRRAWISASERKESLGKMAGCYKEAFDLGRERGKFNVYPLLNWLTGEMTKDWQEEAESAAVQRITDIPELLVRARSELSSDLEKKRDFWTAAMIVDAELLEALLKDSPDEATIDAIAEKYLEARKLGSPREFESTLDQIDFLIAMTENDKPRTDTLIPLRQKLK
jgi:hypothetical protein